MRSQIAKKPARAKKAKLGRIDVSFFFLVIVLVTIGLIMVFSASYATSLYESNSGLTLVKKQCLFVGMGLVAMYLLSYIPYHLYLRMYKVIYFGCLGLTALALAFKDAGNASTSAPDVGFRWDRLAPSAVGADEIRPDCRICGADFNQLPPDEHPEKGYSSVFLST